MIVFLLILAAFGSATAQIKLQLVSLAMFKYHYICIFREPKCPKIALVRCISAHSEFVTSFHQ